jgi:ATPase subunit of ABC transporter with duplicated ATPase domains
LLKEEQALLKKKDEESQKRLVEIYKRLEHIHAFSQEAKASKILSGLGFTADM